MKKILCLLLALIMCASLFAACGGEKEKESDRDSDSEKNKESSVDITEFTGVAATKLSGVNITVYVCDEYKDVLGDTVKVVLPELYDLYVGVGYTVEVTVDYVIDTEPLTVYASSFDAYTYDEPADDYPVAEKPVIYLYPEEDTKCAVRVSLQNGKLTCTYPEHGANGWQNFVARPDGTLVFPDGKQYYALYWEGVTAGEWDFSKGFCVRGEDTAAFLEWALAAQGLSAREANEFIIYWLPIMQENPYNVISFQTKAYTDVANLEIYPCPDSLLRVFMAYYPANTPVEIAPQTFEGFERKGFTVVEWGGSVLE